jgi:hypothetical protein
MHVRDNLFSTGPDRLYNEAIKSPVAVFKELSLKVFTGHDENSRLAVVYPIADHDLSSHDVDRGGKCEMAAL